MATMVTMATMAPWIMSRSLSSDFVFLPSLTSPLFTTHHCRCIALAASKSTYAADLKDTAIPSSTSLRQYTRHLRSLAATLCDRVRARRLSVRASLAVNVKENQGTNSKVRVRFAPSPTGNLHVGGARTALFNYLFAKSKGGIFVLRIEDTDLERSTRESEEMMLRDLRWLGLGWDEGPDNGGSFGPYRQSERTPIYKQFADRLLQSGHVYRCFCTDQELDVMRKEAKENNLPPKYTGKWATASQKDIEDEMEKGTPFTYRFRVPEGVVTINDLIRGEVSWSNDTLGDFIILRSNGQPVYNFCVAVDDATMQITHVIRAEEHLPNTLRQVLIYNALKLPMPHFGHVSLILAHDRSKLSKRHGATSVGQFKEMGFLPEAMVNYLALLGWNDGSEDEIFTQDEIVKKFTIERITKSAAIFDLAKLRWINGQHLHALPSTDLCEKFGDCWAKSGILCVSRGAFINEAAELLKNSIDIVSDAETALIEILSFPVQSTLQSSEIKEIVADNLHEVADVIVAALENGDLPSSLDAGQDGWQKWIKSIGKHLKRKGKRLFMPVRVLLTGKMHGPDIGSTLILIHKAHTSGAVNPKFGLITLSERANILKEIEWGQIYSKFSLPCDSFKSVSTLVQ